MVEMNAPSDRELTAQFAKDRSEAAFGELVRRHLDLVFSAAFRQVGCDTHLAQDVSQEVFVELAQNAGKLASHPALAGWLHETSRRKAAAKMRSVLRSRRIESDPSHMPPTDPEDADPRLLWEALSSHIDAAMGELSSTDRDAIVLRCFRQDSFREIGLRLGLGENAARMRFERALDKLRGRLSARGIGAGSIALGSALSAYGVAPAPVGLAATVVSAAMIPAVGTTGLIGTILVMKKMPLLATLLVAGAGTGVLIQQRADVSRLRAELAAVSIRASAATPERPAPPSASDVSEQERAEARKVFLELLRLRGQVIPLRRQLEETQRKLASANLEAPASTVNASLGRETWNNVGIDTPEKAIQTFLWSDREGDLRTMLLAGGATPALLEESERLGGMRLDGDFRDWQSLEVVSVEYPQANRGRATVLYTKDGVRMARVFRLSRDPNGWRVDFNVGREQVVVPETE